jgi:hypothetical protein
MMPQHYYLSDCGKMNIVQILRQREAIAALVKLQILDVVLELVASMIPSYWQEQQDSH